MNIKLRLSFLLVCMTVVAGYAAPPDKIRYKGSQIYNTEAGISISAKMGRNEAGIDAVALNNYALHYLLFLPYSKSWVFDIADPYHLEGNSGPLNMDIRVLFGTDLSPDEHLAQVKEYLVSDKNPVTPSKIDMITHQGTAVLRTEIDGAKVNDAFQGVKHVNFYCAKKWGGDLYMLHFSKVVPPDRPDPVADEKILHLITAGFFVGPEVALNPEEPQPRYFSLPQHGYGRLALNVPSTWKQTVQRPPDDQPPTITFTPAQGDEFKVLITPIWSPKKDTTFNKSGAINKLIGNDLNNMLPDAVEKEVPIQEFASIDGTGFYFLLTDKAPKPGEYPYAVRAGVGVGDLLLSVTVLSRSKDTEGITATIKALQEARQSVK